jgi:hypothetical protein
MSELMTGLDFARAYLDDLLIISTETGFDKHLEKLEQVLNRLSEAGLKINAVKASLKELIWNIRVIISAEKAYAHHKRKLMLLNG